MSKKKALKDWRVWLKSLISACIGAAAGTVSVAYIDPETFNFTTGIVPLLKVAGVSATLAAANYLKDNPFPGSEK